MDTLEYVLSLSFNPKDELFYFVKNSLMSKKNLKASMAVIKIFSRLFAFFPSKFHTEIKVFFEEKEMLTDNPDMNLKVCLCEEYKHFLLPNHFMKIQAVEFLKKMQMDSRALVQVHSLNSLIQAHFDQKEYIAKVFPVIIKNYDNLCWKMRSTIINNFPKILAKMDSNYYQNFMDIIAFYLSDKVEQNVIDMLHAIPEIRGFLHKNLINNFFKKFFVPFLKTQPSVIQVATVDAIFSLTEKLSQEEILHDYLPLFESLVAEDHNFDLTLHIFKNMGRWLRFLGYENCSGLYLSLKDKLSANQGVQFREKFMKFFVSNTLESKSNTLNEGDLKILELLLKDKSRTVRDGALNVIQQIYSKANQKEVEEKLLPLLT